MPMYFIVMDLIGKFRLLPQSHQCALTTIDMLMNYTWYVSLYTKEPDEVVCTYLVNIYSKFGGAHKILTDHGTEFKNKLFTQDASFWGMKLVFSSSYYPQGNGHIENLYNFLKTYIQSHIFSELACDEVTHMACAAYNIVSNGHSKESAFFLIFGWDVYTLLVQLFNLKLQYMDNDKSLLALVVVQDIYALGIHNIQLSRER